MPQNSQLHFHYLNDEPLLHVGDSPLHEGNINGASLIKVPDWVARPLARYYLYYAHHEGRTVRLAMSDHLLGPWELHEPGALALEDSGFCTEAPARAVMHPDIIAMIDRGDDGDYPHVASPDVHVDHRQQLIKLYYHGRIEDGTQHTRLATSSDGLSFDCQPQLLGRSYFRVFELGGWFYAIAFNGWLYRSADGVSGFECGCRVTAEDLRHCAVSVNAPASTGTCKAAVPVPNDAPAVEVFWSRVYDNPESILVSSLDVSGDWRTWRLQDTRQLHAPERDWEGARLPAEPSSYGGVMTPLRQLRDPAIYKEDEQVYLLYALAGEQGIGIGELRRG